jgi:hypothetical protein
LWELYRTTPTLIIYRVSYVAPNLKKHGYALNTKKNDLVKFFLKKSQKVYRVLDIRELNTKLWMIQVFLSYKAFINFFTAWEKIKNSWNAIDFCKSSPWGIPHGEKSPMQKVYRVLNIAEFNTKMWMVQVLDIDKAFINFFTAWEKSENSWSTIDFRESSPWGIPHGEKFPMGNFQKSVPGSQYSRV